MERPNDLGFPDGSAPLELWESRCDQSSSNSFPPCPVHPQANEASLEGRDLDEPRLAAKWIGRGYSEDESGKCNPRPGNWLVAAA